MKHILIVSQYFYPEQFRINDIAIEWKKAGYKVTVVTAIPNYPKGKFYKGYSLFQKRKEIYNGINIIRLPIIPRGNKTLFLILNYISFMISGFFWSKFTRAKADYVFNFEVSPFTQAKIGVWFAKRRKIPFYIYVQDLWPENIEMVTKIKSKYFINVINKMVDKVYNFSDKILVTSNSFKNNITERGIDGEKIFYFPQYAESVYKVLINGESELICKDGNCNITFTGNIGYAQGLEILPVVAKILKKENIKVHFNIVGDGRNKEQLISIIKQQSVEDYFNMIGYKNPSDIPGILRASDCAFLSFSNNKLFSMTIPAKLQSYLACGMPIIAAAEGETKRIITEGNCGYCTDLGDERALSQSIKDFIILSKGKKIEMGQNAYNYNEKNFNKKELIEYSIKLLFDKNLQKE